MNQDIEGLPARERARVRARDRKMRGPKVIMDNAGLRKVQMDLARRRLKARAAPHTSSQ